MASDFADATFEPIASDVWRKAYDKSLKEPAFFHNDDGQPVEPLYGCRPAVGVRAPARRALVVAHYSDREDLQSRLTSDFEHGLDRARVPLSAWGRISTGDVVFVDPSRWFAAAVASWDCTSDLDADPRAAWLGGHTNDDLHDATSLLTELAVHAHNNERHAICIDASIAHEAGASVAHEIAYALDAGADTLEQLLHAGLSPDDACAQLKFRFALGPDPFEGMIKLRAFRWAWSRTGLVLGASETACLPKIATVLGRRELTERGPWVNALRATTASFAALCSGVVSLEVLPIDAASDEDSAASARLARNTQLILQLESGLERVDDPAGGSGFVEAQTKVAAQTAWKLFQEQRARGPLSDRLMSGSFAKLWAVDAQRRVGRVLVGTNRFQVDDEHRPPNDPRAPAPQAPKIAAVSAKSSERISQALDHLKQGGDPRALQDGFPKQGHARSQLICERDDQRASEGGQR